MEPAIAWALTFASTESDIESNAHTAEHPTSSAPTRSDGERESMRKRAEGRGNKARALDGLPWPGSLSDLTQSQGQGRSNPRGNRGQRVTTHRPSSRSSTTPDPPSLGLTRPSDKHPSPVIYGGVFGTERATTLILLPPARPSARVIFHPTCLSPPPFPRTGSLLPSLSPESVRSVVPFPNPTPSHPVEVDRPLVLPPTSI